MVFFFQCEVEMLIFGNLMRNVGYFKDLEDSKILCLYLKGPGL